MTNIPCLACSHCVRSNQDPESHGRPVFYSWNKSCQTGWRTPGGRQTLAEPFVRSLGLYQLWHGTQTGAPQKETRVKTMLCLLGGGGWGAFLSAGGVCYCPLRSGPLLHGWRRFGSGTCQEGPECYGHTAIHLSGLEPFG